MIAAMTEAQITNPRSLESMRMLAHAASPITTEVLKRACEQFPNAEFIHVYGATETTVVTALRSENLLIATSPGPNLLDAPP